MSKKFLIVSAFILNAASLAIAQQKDSLTLEMERLNRLGDSLHREQLKRDSAFYDMLNNTAKDIERIKNEANQKNIEQATEQVLKQHKKEQKQKQKTLWLGLLAFLVTVTAAGVYFKRKRNNTNVS